MGSEQWEMILLPSPTIKMGQFILKCIPNTLWTGILNWFRVHVQYGKTMKTVSSREPLGTLYL